MKPALGICCFVLVLIVPLVSFADATVTSTSVEQTGVELTVYNNDLGLVKETRTVELPGGGGELKFMDVAAHIMPVTVHVKSINQPGGFTVLEQNYEYDLMNQQKLLDKYVGKKLKIVDWNKYQDRKEVVEAVLLSNNQGQVYGIGDEIYLGHPGIKVLPKLPEDLIAKPTLTWLYENGSKEPHQLEVSYLTGKINWRADYVVVLNKDDTEADISGWVTLDNKSGGTYRNARLKLVAGDVHRIVEERVPLAMAPRRKDLVAPAEPQFREQAFFEYHIYDLQRKTTVKDNQTKQVSLLEANKVKVTKELLVYGIRSYFTSQFQEKSPKQPVNVYVKFKNSKENSLGMPLPAGIMRLYKQDADGSGQFIGEDKVDHTPKDEEVKLKIGEAFDVVAERVQTDFKRLTRAMYETEWEVTVRNHKDQPVSVGLVEPLFGNWEVISKSHPYTKVDAHTIRFDVTVPKDGQAKVTYRVRVGI
ncbi:MAG: DUF4139 domain-containing protein [Desulfomonilaceae bacterium]|nr:DUF4139 domain-containing protein [Desulfomonilaceae bacterium]